MDMAYLRAHPEHLPTFLTHQRIRETPVHRGVCTASRLTLDDGTSLFAKTWPAGDAPAGLFAAEAEGLRWLRASGAVPVPEILVTLPRMIAMEWVEPGDAGRQAAEDLGRGLAALHRSGAESFGAPWPGWIGPLPLDNTPCPGPWSTWFAERRLLPYLRISADQGALSGADTALVEEVVKTIDRYAVEEPPARLHGDLWPGNVLWGADGRAWLVDPAAHGGHRETDLATLALFGGVPHLDVILDAYRAEWPLAAGWRSRVPLHQLHLLLVHTAAFGAGYRGAVVAAAEAVLRS
ncbi:fructosamine kinase family protein [Actinoplanes awajinensis]|uniref:Aminoglycoside phosphotransferase n=1 Tax=Actinoplanes awajinensis subsp. mycoplanecinus TaxID=135947 RepID=A0A0X3UP93_9ACTN|nr:fructosamine kinase family protein [Actinoplanes awajinensis]KUL34428.1 aminoglycoside phosphotransferase [Actinoplanes awajinensis subsp. mycoplanecinus]